MHKDIFVCQHKLDRDCVCVFWTPCSSIPSFYHSTAVKEKKTCQARRGGGGGEFISQPPVSNRNTRNRGVFPISVKKRSMNPTRDLQRMLQTVSYKLQHGSLCAHQHTNSSSLCSAPSCLFESQNCLFHFYLPSF